MIVRTLECELDLPFKGNRGYIQSADIFDACAAEIISSSGLPRDLDASFVFRSLLSTRMRLLLPETGNIETNPVNLGADVFGEIVLKSSEGRYIGYMVRDEREARQRKQDFEGELKGEATICGKSIVLAQRNAKLTPIETAVALTKLLHTSIVSNQVKWLATRLQFPIGFSGSRFQTMTVKIERNANDKATHSAVSCDGKPVGSVMFNAVPLKG